MLTYGCSLLNKVRLLEELDSQLISLQSAISNLAIQVLPIAFICGTFSLILGTFQQIKLMSNPSAVDEYSNQGALQCELTFSALSNSEDIFEEESLRHQSVGNRSGMSSCNL